MTDNTSDIIISPFVMADYEEVVSLWKMCEGIGLSAADSPEKIRAYLDRNPGMSFIVRKNEKIAGAVLSGHDGRRGFIHHLAVHPGFRKKGIGRKLANECVSALEAAGIEKCHLFIFRKNESGIKFWKMAGWTMREDIGIMSKDVNVHELSGSTIGFKGCSC